MPLQDVRAHPICDDRKAPRKPERQRRKTGCITCRMRRLKCDEDKPHCRRCKASGRNCEGYSIIPFTRRELVAAASAAPCSGSHHTGSSNWEVTSSRDTAYSNPVARLITDPAFSSVLEKRYFQFFRLQTVASTNVLIDSRFWDRVVLQASHAEPAIKHAALALSAWHQQSYAHERQHDPAAGAQHRLYADKQYGLALHHAQDLVHQSSASPPTPQLIDRILIACIICITYEAVRGDYPASQTHMTSGRAIARAYLSSSPRYPRFPWNRAAAIASGTSTPNSSIGNPASTTPSSPDVSISTSALPSPSPAPSDPSTSLPLRPPPSSIPRRRPTPETAEITAALARLDVGSLCFADCTAPYAYSLTDFHATSPRLEPGPFAHVGEAQGTFVDLLRWLLVIIREEWVIRRGDDEEKEGLEDFRHAGLVLPGEDRGKDRAGFLRSLYGDLYGLREDGDVGEGGNDAGGEGDGKRKRTREEREGRVREWLRGERERCGRAMGVWKEEFEAAVSSARAAAAQAGTDDPGAELRVLNLRQWHATASVLMGVDFRGEEAQFDAWTGAFATVVACAEEIVTRLRDAGEGAGSFGYDFGYTMSVFMTAARCRDPGLRRRAVRVLDFLPRQEGIWASRLLAAVARRWIEIEEEGLGGVGSAADVPEHRRIKVVSDATIFVQEGYATLDFLVDGRVMKEEIVTWGR